MNVNTPCRLLYPVTLWSRLRRASGICDGTSYVVPAGGIVTVIRTGKYTAKVLCAGEHNGHAVFGWLDRDVLRSLDIVEFTLGPL